MKVILRSELAELGEEGDIVDVSKGYARNYLIPAKKAIPCNNQNVALLESQKNTIQLRREARRKEYLTLKERIEETNLVIKMKAGEKGHLYGAVTSTVVAEYLEKQGLEILKKQIVIPSHSIKEVGTYAIEIRLLSGIVATLNVIVEDEDADKKEKQRRETAHFDSEGVRPERATAHSESEDVHLESEDVPSDSGDAHSENEDVPPSFEHVEESTVSQPTESNDGSVETPENA